MTGERVETAGERLRVAMLGTTDGGFIDPDSDVPAGEMYRLAAEVLPDLIAAAYAQGGRDALVGHRCDDQAERAYRRAVRAEKAARDAYAQGGRDALTAAADLIDEVIDEHGIEMRDGSRGCYDDDHEDRVTYSVVGEEELRKVEGSLRARAAQIGADQ